MSDNTSINPGANGDTIVTEDTGDLAPTSAGFLDANGRPIKVPVSKIYTGDHGQSSGPVTYYNPFPVVLVPADPLAPLAGGAIAFSATGSFAEPALDLAPSASPKAVVNPRLGNVPGAGFLAGTMG